MPRFSNNFLADRNRLPCFLSADCMALTVVVLGTRALVYVILLNSNGL